MRCHYAGRGFFADDPVPDDFAGVGRIFEDAAHRRAGEVAAAPPGDSEGVQMFRNDVGTGTLIHIHVKDHADILRLILVDFKGGSAVYIDLPIAEGRV